MVDQIESRPESVNTDGSAVEFEHDGDSVVDKEKGVVGEMLSYFTVTVELYFRKTLQRLHYEL
jgi:hypothetical protein